MSKPFSFRQSGLPWTIHWNDDDSFDTDFRGRTLFDKYQVHVNSHMLEDLQRQALLHELIHVCSDVILMDDDRLTEAQVRAVSQGLFDIIYYNPEVAHYLIGD